MPRSRHPVHNSLETNDMAFRHYGIIATVKLKLIDSPSNPVIKRTVEVRQRRTRGSKFVLEGPHLIEAALDAGAAIAQVFVTDKFKSSAKNFLKTVARTGAEVYEVSERAFKKISDTETPQGILAVATFRPVHFEEVDLKSPLVVLDGVQDPGNLGTIIRTADAAGASAVLLLEGTCDAFSQKALRSSSGSIFNIPVLSAKRKTVAGKLHKSGFRIVVTTLEAEASLFEADLAGSLAFVFGNETRGVSSELRGKADLAVRIPISGRAESLNVASSAAVVLYEVLRRGT